MKPYCQKNPALDLLERFRMDVLANLAFSWGGDDLCEPVTFHMAIANAPSPTKDALSCQLLEGELVRNGGGLQGTLALTALGRLAVRRFRRNTGMFA